jgi:hypothetical protein
MPRPKRPDPGRRVRELLAATEPTEYQAFFDHLLALAVAVREELATRLSPRLSAQVRAVPHDTYAEKQELAKWVNGQLRQLGLAVRCPKTGRAAILVADLGPNPEKGRFQIQTVHDRKRTLSSVDLPDFSLMPADLRQDYVKSPRKKKSG